MPYDTSGDWIRPVVADMTNPCTCHVCLRWEQDHGVTPHQQWLNSLTEPVYNDQGYDQMGFNADGFTCDGYNRRGFDAYGYDQQGYDDSGLDRDGRDRTGYDMYGRDADGYDYNGFNVEGYDVNGYDGDGYDREGRDREGYNFEGWDREGYSRSGRNMEGFNRAGFDRAGFNLSGFDRYGNERPCDCHDCMLERGEVPALVRRTTEDVELPETSDYYGQVLNDRDWLHNYSFTPSPLIFRRSHGEDRRAVPFYGMEIEMTSRCTEQECQLGNEIGLMDRLLYFKADGSVDGFEMVTHPMTAKWARDNFPWDVVEVMAEAGASVNEDCNGLHVHVSRAGFKNEAHLYRWLKFWYRNQDEIIGIAGRDGASWGAFDPDQRVIHGEHAAAHAKYRHLKVNSPTLLHEQTGERYSAINLQNPKTVEVRLFAATTRASMLRSRFELVAGSVEYTRDLPVKKINEGGWDWDQFLLWLDEHSTEYSALSSYENGSILRAIQRRQATKEPELTLA